DSGEHDEAASLEEENVRLSSETITMLDPLARLIRVTLANCYRLMGRFEDALGPATGILEWCEKVMGPHHEDTIRARTNYAVLHSDNGKFEDAEQILRESLESILTVRDNSEEMSTRAKTSQDFSLDGVAMLLAALRVKTGKGEKSVVEAIEA